MKKLILSVVQKMLSSKNSRVKKYVETNPNLEFENNGNIVFVKFNKQITKNEIVELIEKLWENQFEISLHDTLYPFSTGSDPGAYFFYSTEKTISQEYWSMTYGNHGWSGGIYHLRRETVIQQIYNLVSLGEMDKIQITEVSFFSHYEIESKEESDKKNKEIMSKHE